MSPTAELVTRINQSIASSDERIQKEVAVFIEQHPDDVGRQLAKEGFALIPTFAGDYTLTRDALEELID